jgi:hypothetical protein
MVLVVGFRETKSGKELIVGKIGDAMYFYWLCNPFSEAKTRNR